MVLWLPAAHRGIKLDAMEAYITCVHYQPTILVALATVHAIESQLLGSHLLHPLDIRNASQAPVHDRIARKFTVSPRLLIRVSAQTWSFPQKYTGRPNTQSLANEFRQSRRQQRVH